MVKADHSLLRVVLVNLLGNVYKFTARHPTLRIELGVIEREDHPVYFVRHDGAGFDMKYADKLFGTFHRLHNTSDFEGTGIGLALAIVRQLVQVHGGQIHVNSTAAPGRDPTANVRDPSGNVRDPSESGTTFTIELERKSC